MKNIKRLILLCFLSSNAQQKQQDTIFLVNNKYQKVYIDFNKKSDEYEVLSAFFNSAVKGDIKLREPNEKWVPVYIYNEAYYVYVPCDFGNHHPIQIIGEELIIGGMETAINTIINRQKSSKNVFKVEYKDYDGTRKCLEYTVVDKQKGITVFNYNGDYRLMVQAKKIKNYPIIVNKCKQGKMAEFVFDKPNYEVLLKNKTEK